MFKWWDSANVCIWKCIETELWMLSSVCSCREREPFSQNKKLTTKKSKRIWKCMEWVQQMRTICFLRTAIIGMWNEWLCIIERWKLSIDPNGSVWMSFKSRKANQWLFLKGIQQQVLNNFRNLDTLFCFSAHLYLIGFFSERLWSESSDTCQS